MEASALHDVVLAVISNGGLEPKEYFANLKHWGVHSKGDLEVAALLIKTLLIGESNLEIEKAYLDFCGDIHVNS